MRSDIFYLPYLACIYLTSDLLEVCFLYIFYIVGHNSLFLLHLLNKLLATQNSSKISRLNIDFLFLALLM